MPWLPLSPCSVKRCPGRAPAGSHRCPDHEREWRQQQNLKRRKQSNADYDAKWRALREAFLNAHPLCECPECRADGLTRAASVVDHIESIAERPDLRLSWSNLRAMNKQCHDRHTARTRGFGRAGGG
jgi:5-methylcytosine-specific restriction protein A